MVWLARDTIQTRVSALRQAGMWQDIICSICGRPIQTVGSYGFTSGQSLTDADLLNCFGPLGPGDLVLLEDIDCAGLGREVQSPIQEDAVLVSQPQYTIQENDDEKAISPGHKKDSESDQKSRYRSP